MGDQVRRLRLLCAVLALVLVAGACGRSDDSESGASTTAAPDTPTTAAGGDGATTTVDKCAGQTLEATDIGVSESQITVTVMADVGSALAPGLFQGNVDALNAFADYVNANGGIACRDLVVKTWDSKLDPTEAKNGLIDACSNSVAMVGNNALFNPDATPLTDCVDKNGAKTGLPDITALANDINEVCAPTTFVVQAVTETCPVKLDAGPRPIKVVVAAPRYYVENFGPDLHGLFLVPGDLPTTVQSATPQIAGQAQVGITWDGTMKVSGRDEQPAYTPRIQAAKAAGSTYMYMGSNDRAMIRLRKEAKAQGLDTVKVWACSLACYTKAFLEEGGADVEDTYVWMQFLPFEEADSNEALKAYVDSIGIDKVDSFGAQAWQAALAFKYVVDGIVEKDGPNAVTRASILEGLKNIEGFDAGGWSGPNTLRGVSDCFVLLQVKSGKFERVFPEEKGTLSCDPKNVITVDIDTVAEAAKIN
jgi:ABC-type branched-subunit amino acid transport system substrate-binding protein